MGGFYRRDHRVSIVVRRAALDCPYLTEHRPSATFSEADYPANLAAQQRMILLAGGSMERVIPGHDALQFQKYPGAGRIANIH